MADYLERLRRAFQLPVMNGVRVDRLSREGDRYLVEAGALEFEADARGGGDGELSGTKGPRRSPKSCRPRSSSSTPASTSRCLS